MVNSGGWVYKDVVVVAEQSPPHLTKDCSLHPINCLSVCQLHIAITLTLLTWNLAKKEPKESTIRSTFGASSKIVPSVFVGPFLSSSWAQNCNRVCCPLVFLTLKNIDFTCQSGFGLFRIQHTTCVFC